MDKRQFITRLAGELEHTYDLHTIGRSEEAITGEHIETKLVVDRRFEVYYHADGGNTWLEFWQLGGDSGTSPAVHIASIEASGPGPRIIENTPVADVAAKIVRGILYAYRTGLVKADDVARVN